jgi:hypothetical protein
MVKRVALSYAQLVDSPGREFTGVVAMLGHLEMALAIQGAATRRIL